ncbi:unnamed protein product [Dimorphilus gyrociliatus]|uniref:Uncharacterized protein n=1 Tax=Dimorphilus gyrociliatus TaxID=2664684 RepID=A0A7I8VLQ9_9ANNE|nr:unnamed protein product [Dimorphilus gyrociliatus]
MGNKLCPTLGRGRRKNSFKLTPLDDPSRHARKRPVSQHAKASKYMFESPKKENTAAESPVNSKAPSIRIEEDEEIVLTINDAIASKEADTDKQQIVCHENMGFESSSEDDNSLRGAKSQSTELPTKTDQLTVQNLDDIRFRTTPDSSVASVRGSCNSDQFDDSEIKDEVVAEEEADEDFIVLNRTVHSIQEEIVTTATSKEIAEMTTKEDQFEDIMQKLEQMVNETTSLLEKTKYRESVHDNSLIAFMDFIKKKHEDDESNQIISEMEEKENENLKFSQSLNKQMAEKLAAQDLSSAECWRLLSEHKKVVQDVTRKRLEERQRLLGKLREKLKNRSDFREQEKDKEIAEELASKSSDDDEEEANDKGDLQKAQDDQSTMTTSNQVAGEVVVHHQISDDTSSLSSQAPSDEISLPVATRDGESAIEKENDANEATEKNQFSISFNIQQDGVLKQDEKLEHLLELNTVNAICRENITKNDIATVLSNYQDERERIGKLREAERHRVLESVQMKLMEKRTVISMEMENIGEELEKMLRHSTDQTQIRELVRTQLQNL